MWTRARFNDEYVPGLFALAIDTYITKRTEQMWRALMTLKTSQKKKEEEGIRSGLGLPVIKGEGAPITYDTQIAGAKQSWVPTVYALAVNFLAAIKLCELLEHPNVKSRTISSQASIEEGSTTIPQGSTLQAQWKRRALERVMI